MGRKRDQANEEIGAMKTCPHCGHVHDKPRCHSCKIMREKLRNRAHAIEEGKSFIPRKSKYSKTLSAALVSFQKRVAKKKATAR